MDLVLVIAYTNVITAIVAAQEISLYGLRGSQRPYICFVFFILKGLTEQKKNINLVLFNTLFFPK